MGGECDRRGAHGRRPDRDAGGHLRHRARADRRQGPLRFDARGGEPLRLKLRALLQLAPTTFPAGAISPTVVADLEEFVFERYRNQLATLFQREVVDAVVDIRPPLDEVPSRVAAVRELRVRPEARALAAANKRVANILRKSGAEAAVAVDRSLFGDGAEHNLF